MAKMNKKWVVLCSTAIGAIYASGYFVTATQTSMQQPPSLNQATMAAGSSTTKSQYKNGTFSGTGSNRRGSIEVAVSIKNDKITDVEISRFAMHYSERDVIGLPEEAVRIQSAQVHNVSGATYSVQAFKDAIKNALSLAQNS
jgi:uncharacterized protein with FMN-binding domain